MESNDQSACAPEDAKAMRESAANEPSDFATVARRIARLSGNLLLTAVIIILGLTFGKQVLRWWSGKPPAVAVGPSDLDDQLQGLADPNLPHQLAFSDMSLSLLRSVFVGNERAALARLREECRRVATEFNSQSDTAIQVDEKALQRLATFNPIEQGPGWRIVQHGGPVITVVALRTAATPTGSDEGDASQKVESVVSWGLGLRAPETETEEETSPVRWTLFTCTGASQKVNSDPYLSSPIPPASRRTLAMQVEGGGALIGFDGQGTVSSSKQFYDESLAEKGWSRTKAWTRIGSNWHARFSNPEAGSCDVQLRDNDDGGTSGILTLYSTASNSEK